MKNRTESFMVEVTQHLRKCHRIYLYIPIVLYRFLDAIEFCKKLQSILNDKNYFPYKLWLFIFEILEKTKLIRIYLSSKSITKYDDDNAGLI